MSEQHPPASGDDFLRHRRLLEAFAVAMHSLTCGDWGAAGFETQESFRAAANAALDRLHEEGHDLLGLLPKRARGEMPS